ncbi:MULTISPECIES: hypothetical protein [unclassified Pseudonocardia]|uniref:hypothetical protein n=1 Tax=unclassified Pseudonocardia TaxID=2619320 RepID=UPI0009611C0F|nr:MULTISPECIES: hypothetical protein [unclassified Pseudonocardia]OLL73681.1 hypothetical protein Ae150APs1_2059 [Pseudonocardia sp. Ae150A_Ps1]OLL86205.1 hypothetical protein Ae263Ps1_3260c [Pseudonocardia sp. Ae263_Ps1]OLL93764.1 hypothetical protein Ae356Ps1_3661 [Pseudonocardia sp. Ae356_Ps1]
MPAPIVQDRRMNEWFDLLDQQAGMVSIAQLRTFGVGDAETLAQVDGGRWSGFVRSVYATFTGPPPRPSMIAGALLYGGPAAALSHRTAAEEWGLVPVGPPPVHLTVPYRSSAISQHGRIVVHRSRAHRHIVTRTVPPRTSMADTAIDLAVECDDAITARTTLVGLLTGGRVRPLEVELRLTERPPRRYRRALLGAVSMVRHGVHSALEEAYLVRVEQAHGLPAGRRQTPLSVDGQTLWEDVTYDEAGYTLTVRLDGRTHLRGGVAFRDRRRDNAAELLGRSRLVSGWREVDGDPFGVAREVGLVLRRLGWGGRQGPQTGCAVCGS